MFSLLFFKAFIYQIGMVLYNHILKQTRIVGHLCTCVCVLFTMCSQRHWKQIHISKCFMGVTTATSEKFTLLPTIYECFLYFIYFPVPLITLDKFKIFNICHFTFCKLLTFSSIPYVWGAEEKFLHSNYNQLNLASQLLGLPYQNMGNFITQELQATGGVKSIPKNSPRFSNPEQK